MLSISDAARAYRRSAYNAIEYDIAYRLDSASLPVFGGTIAGFKLLGNGLARPFKVGGAFLFSSSEAAPTPQETPIPADVQNTELGKDLLEWRKAQRRAVDEHASGWGMISNGNYRQGFRQFAVAEHTSAKAQSTIMPEDIQRQIASNSGLAGLAGVIAGTTINGPVYQGGINTPSPGVGNAINI